MNKDYIVRDFELTRIGGKACSNFIQSLALCNGTIISSAKLTNGLNESQVTYYSMFFKLSFTNQDELDRFHSRGLHTTNPEQITGQ